jgi:pantoate--beta-alanine ligase
MGALHAGHLDLVRQAKEVSDLCVVSIFVNPRQFNNAEDLRKYPRTILPDLDALNAGGADIVFVPVPTEIFDQIEPIRLDLGPLGDVLEGKFRPGHFQGVVDVLHAFFSLIRPNQVFFGQKDLQQCMVVEKLIAAYFPEIKQHNCPTLREPSGLAMSSRNTRLSAEGLQKAAAIYKELATVASERNNFPQNIQKAGDRLSKLGFDIEYLDLVALPDLNRAQELLPQTSMALVFAGYLEGVRLIDNVIL